MPVLTAGRTGATWGLNEESGIIAQHGTWKTSIEENPKKNKDGEYQMTSWYNPTQSISLYGISLGSGLSNALVGVAIAMANGFGNNGVNSGSVYVTSVEQAPSNTGFVAVSLTAVRRPLI